MHTDHFIVRVEREDLICPAWAMGNGSLWVCTVDRSKATRLYSLAQAQELCARFERVGVSIGVRCTLVTER